jgi:hypothetical protein
MVAAAASGASKRMRSAVDFAGRVSDGTSFAFEIDLCRVARWRLATIGRRFGNGGPKVPTLLLRVHLRVCSAAEIRRVMDAECNSPRM